MKLSKNEFRDVFGQNVEDVVKRLLAYGGWLVVEFKKDEPIPLYIESIKGDEVVLIPLLDTDRIAGHYQRLLE